MVDSMKKIPTLFVINYKGKGAWEITSAIHPKAEWVYTEKNVIATQKFDGTAVLIQDGRLYKRYDAKPTKEAFRRHIQGAPWKVGDFREVPDGAIKCQEPDLITGHFPHWVPCIEGRPEDRYYWEAFKEQTTWVDGTYELCGEKVGTNPEKITGHKLIKHGSVVIKLPDFSFTAIKQYLQLEKNNIEGLVLYGEDNKMCKIRKSDFGVLRHK